MLKENESLTRLHFHIYTSDLEVLRETYGNSIGVSMAIRSIIRQFLEQLKLRQEPSK